MSAIFKSMLTTGNGQTLFFIRALCLVTVDYGNTTVAKVSLYIPEHVPP